VAKTGDIKEFTIMEESGIAKGIRRMIAVTGPEARVAISTAAAFESRFASVQNMSGKEKDEGFKTLTLVRGSLNWITIGLLIALFLRT
jgi:alanyl-tRNA synthetase